MLEKCTDFFKRVLIVLWNIIIQNLLKNTNVDSYIHRYSTVNVFEKKI